MGVLRASVIIYSDTELVAELIGHSLTAYVDMYRAAREGHPYPPLYEAGVKYQREPPGSEVWMIARGIIAAGEGDCEDLSAGYRVPQLWMLGEVKARPYVRRISPSLRHILVERADGSIEDPSLILGMHDKSDPAEKVAARRAVKPVMRQPGPLAIELPRWTT